MGEEHGQATAIHKVHEWEHADATARNAESVTIDDIGKVSWQQDTDTFYVLADAVPTWIELANPFGFQGDTGDGPGDTGVQGDTGIDVGFHEVSLNYNFSTTTTGPPSSGEIRINNSDPFYHTAMWIHGTDRNGLDRTHLLDLIRPGDVLYIQSEADGDLIFDFVKWISYSSGYYTLEVDYRDATTYTNGENIQLEFSTSSPTSDGERDVESIATHVDGTWYTVGRGYVNFDSTLIMSALVSGHSDDAATSTWAYYVLGWLRNDGGSGGTFTHGFLTPVNITEYDNAYDVRLYNSGGGSVFFVQVRRSGGANYAIDWSATVRYAMFAAST